MAPVAALVERSRLDVEALVAGQHHGDVDAAGTQGRVGVGQDALAQRFAIVRNRAEDVHFGGLHGSHGVAPAIVGLRPGRVLRVAADRLAVAREHAIVRGECVSCVRQRHVVRHDDGVGEVGEHVLGRELLLLLDFLLFVLAAAGGWRRRCRARLLRLAGAVDASRQRQGGDCGEGAQQDPESGSAAGARCPRQGYQFSTTS